MYFQFSKEISVLVLVLVLDKLYKNESLKSLSLKKCKEKNVEKI
jgi:hypothetical protein